MTTNPTQQPSEEQIVLIVANFQDRYLRTITELAMTGYINNSLDRELTDQGREVVKRSFPDGLDVEKIVTDVRYLRLADPNHSQRNAFVHEASLAIHNSISPERRAEVYVVVDANNPPLPPFSGFILGGISVLEQAVKRGMMAINPSGCPRNGKQHVGYVVDYRETH